MQRNRTRKATDPEDVSGAIVDSAPQYAMDKKLEDFLNLNASEAYKRPWHRLERGLRMNRLRKFVEAEKVRMSLSDQDTELLRARLEKAFEKKLLNSKSAVIYDSATETIQEIKGLVYHKSADGRMLSNFMEKKAGVTFRRKAPATAAVPQQNVNVSEGQ